ncbi:MAG: rplV [Acidimicrobiales bacterium]|nr:rplV [Acidimicrobiales bacterium]
MAQSGTKIAAVRETRKGATIYKTNERPGTRAEVRYVRVSAYKAREVLDLIRGKHVNEADEILQFTERDISNVIRKGLASAVANATNNDDQDPETLFVSACFADEGPTLKRWRPRARGRATRIRKRTCHITIIVSRLPESQLKMRAEREAVSGRAGAGAAGRASRRARVAESKRAAKAEAAHDHDHDHELEEPTAEVVESTEAEETTDAPAAEVEEITDAPEAEVEAAEAPAEEAPVAETDAAEAADDATETDEKDEK